MRVLMRVSVGMRVFVRVGYAVMRMLVRMNVRMKVLMFMGVFVIAFHEISPRPYHSRFAALRAAVILCNVSEKELVFCWWFGYSRCRRYGAGMLLCSG